MRKTRLFLVLCAAGFSVLAVGAVGASTSSATTGCSGFDTFAGGYSYANPAAQVGKIFEANINASSFSVNSGNVRAYVRILFNGGQSISAGIRSQAGQPMLYTEDDGQILSSSWPESFGTSYTVEVSHYSASNWRLYINGQAQPAIPAIPSSSSVAAVYYAVNDNNGSADTCNSMDFHEYSLYPYSTDQLHRIYPPGTGPPWIMTNITTNGFEVKG
jgi:hypothetical protein